VRSETGLIVSVGAAATKFVAKVASGLSKPDGLLVIPRDETVPFLHPLPIAKLWGVGGKTEEVLRARGIHTIGDLANTPVDALRRVVGDAGASRLHELAWGIDPRAVHEGPDEKSIGHEMTFESDVTDPDIIRRELLRMSNMVAVRLRKADFVARTVVLKLRFADFTTITRSRTIKEPTDLGRRIYEEVREVYEATGKQYSPIRLVGVRAEQLVDKASAQLGLWDDAEGWREAEDVMDAASAKFGRNVLKPAALLRSERTERPRLGQRD
jgi:DNA polymerase-4